MQKNAEIHKNRKSLYKLHINFIKKKTKFTKLSLKIETRLFTNRGGGESPWIFFFVGGGRVKYVKRKSNKRNPNTGLRCVTLGIIPAKSCSYVQ